MIHEFIGGEAAYVIGHGYERFQAFVTCSFPVRAYLQPCWA